MRRVGEQGPEYDRALYLQPVADHEQFIAGAAPTACSVPWISTMLRSEPGGEQGRPGGRRFDGNLSPVFVQAERGLVDLEVAALVGVERCNGRVAPPLDQVLEYAAAASPASFQPVRRRPR